MVPAVPHCLHLCTTRQHRLCELFRARSHPPDKAAAWPDCTIVLHRQGAKTGKAHRNSSGQGQRTLLAPQPRIGRRIRETGPLVLPCRACRPGGSVALPELSTKRPRGRQVTGVARMKRKGLTGPGCGSPPGAHTTKTRGPLPGRAEKGRGILRLFTQVPLIVTGHRAKASSPQNHSHHNMGRPFLDFKEKAMAISELRSLIPDA